MKRVFSLAVLTAGSFVQYTREDAAIRGALQDYGEFNSMFVSNNSDEVIAVDLDFTTSKRTIIPAHVIMTIDQVSYLEFQVTNLSATDTTAGEVIITAINERPLSREAR
jgi:hypothetical protein